MSKTEVPRRGPGAEPQKLKTYNVHVYANNHCNRMGMRQWVTLCSLYNQQDSDGPSLGLQITIATGWVNFEHRLNELSLLTFHHHSLP